MSNQENENPKLFISYSWTSPEHEEWVLNLAEELVEAGVDVILDKWDLKEGNDAYAFMEKMVVDSEIKKVILICDEAYAKKADDRSGGVGTEAQIMSQEIYEKADQDKFVAVVKEKDDNGKAYLPVYYKSRIYIDLSDNEEYAKNFEKLLRWIYDEPLNVKPEIGEKPAFLDNNDNISIGTSYKFKRALDAIKKGKNYANGALIEYFNSLTEGLDEFRIIKSGNEEFSNNEFDEEFIKNIDKFIPYRNEAIEIFNAIGTYKNLNNIKEILHSFFENLIPYFFKPKEITTSKNWDFDNFKFIIHELFLYCISSLIKHGYFQVVAYLLNKRYYIKDPQNRMNMQSFAIFRDYLNVLEHRNKRLNLRKQSLHGYLLKERCHGTGIKFNNIMQTDFILFLRNKLDKLNSDEDFSYRSWYPYTLIYNSYFQKSFELFARAESKDYFNSIKSLFNINEPKDFQQLFNAIEKGNIKLPREVASNIAFIKSSIGYDNLASRV